MGKDHVLDFSTPARCNHDCLRMLRYSKSSFAAPHGSGDRCHDKRPCEQDKRRAKGTFQTPNLGAAKPGTQVLVTGPSYRKFLGLCPCVDRKMVVDATNKKNKSWLCQLLCVVIAVFVFWYLMEIANPASFLYTVHIIWPLLLAKVVCM